jgi:GAF domain-containing protein
MMSTVAAMDRDLAETLASVARALAGERDLSAVINRTCQLAVATIDGCEHADLMVIAPGGAVTAPAATDWVGTRIVSMEAEFNEGPCVQAATTGEVVESADISTERRWPNLVPRVLKETPVLSTMGLPLIVHDRPIGALDLYGHRPGAFGDEQRAAAALFTAHAAVAFGAARERQQFEEALASRDLIGQAKGILMAQSKVTSDEAFSLLRRASQRMNKKLTAVAQQIVDATAPSPPE